MPGKQIIKLAYGICAKCMASARIQVVIITILSYLKNGQGLNEVIETSNITQAECLEAVDIIEKALKEKKI